MTSEGYLTDNRLLTWFFNPWDYGDSALVFAFVVFGGAILAAPFRRRIGGVAATSVVVAATVSVAYTAGAIGTQGFGPLFMVGFGFLLAPALVISFVVIGAFAAIDRLRSHAGSRRD